MRDKMFSSSFNILIQFRVKYELNIFTISHLQDQ